MNCYGLPTSIEINGTEYAITERGDFRMVLDCFSLLNDEEIPKGIRIADCLKIFLEDVNSDEDVLQINVEEAVEKMFSFFNCNQLEVGTKANLKLLDWEQDSQLVCAAINNVAQTEIRSEPYLHWWTFMGYYISVGESVLATVISLREKRKTGKKLEKHEQEFIRNNPQYFTTKKEIEEQQADEEWLASVWNKE